MRWIIRIYTVILLAYTGWRTYDFMINQLPAGELSWWLALLFLFATEVGLAIWHEVSIGHTTTYTQHYLATGLTWLDFAGSLGAGVADMIIRQTVAEYSIPPLLVSALIYGLPAIVAMNIAGALIFLANDAEMQRLRARRFLEFEADKQALDEISASRRKLVTSRKKEIITDLTGNFNELPAQSDGHNHTEQEIITKVLANPTRRRRSK